MRSFAFLIAVFILLTIALGYVTGVPGETGWRLVVGWLAFIGRTLSRVTVNWSGVGTIGLCAALLLIGGHRFAVWLSSAWETKSPSAALADTPVPPRADAGSRGIRAWPLRRTALLLAIVVLMFVAGISFIGLVHQTVWLATTPEPMTEYRLNRQRIAPPNLALQMTGLSFNNWADVFKQPPSNGAWPKGDQGIHSWQGRIVPFIMLADNIDFHLDWNHPKNAPAFRRFVPHYLSPEFGVLREARGYAAVTHFAGNVRFFEPQPPAMEAIKKRGQGMIVCGEVAHDFMAWGDPANLRDPLLGINRSRAGFGDADAGGATFLMADGSTRFLATGIDPTVMAVLASPEPLDNGGDSQSAP